MVTLKELTPTIETLNKQTNAVNEVIADLNAKLEKLKIGISIANDFTLCLHESGWRVMRDVRTGDPVERIRTGYYLGYEKLHDHWQLALVSQEISQAYEGERPKKDYSGPDSLN